MGMGSGGDGELNSEINGLMPTIYPASGKGSWGEEIGHPLFWGGLGNYGNLWNEAPFRPRSGFLERRYVAGKDLLLHGGKVSRFPLERVQRLQPPEPGNPQLQLLSAAGSKRSD